MSSGPAPTRITNTRMAYRTEHPNGIAVRLLHSYSNTFTGAGGPQELITRAISGERHPAISASDLASARQLREREVDQLVARYLDVRNMRQVAREWQISRTTVAKHLADRGIDTSRRMNGTEVAEAARLYAEGWSSIRIGQRLGFDNHTVLAALRGAGAEIRSPAASRRAPSTSGRGLVAQPTRQEVLGRSKYREETPFRTIDLEGPSLV
ncbi:DNA-binding CsgD family transcriptional regulator [Aurantimicrobium minutum]|nr:DNA-binding CsgD family transcriptional regulator [Aurantimicrobium minutum]